MLWYPGHKYLTIINYEFFIPVRCNYYHVSARKNSAKKGMWGEFILQNGWDFVIWLMFVEASLARCEAVKLGGFFLIPVHCHYHLSARPKNNKKESYQMWNCQTWQCSLCSIIPLKQWFSTFFRLWHLLAPNFFCDTQPLKCTHTSSSSSLIASLESQWISTF